MTHLPKELITRLQSLADDFETHIRRDERKRLLAKFRDTFPATGNNTDMHGMPLSVPVTGRRLAPSVEALRSVLAVRSYPVTIRTVCRVLDISPTAAHWRMKELRRAGYPVETIRTGGRLAKYRLA